MRPADLGLNLLSELTRKREFLDEMNRLMPCVALIKLVSAHVPEGKKGRPPFPVETLLRIRFMQQWFTLSDPAVEEALHDVPLFREFAVLDNWSTRLPDESTILRFRHLLEKHKLALQILATVNSMLRSKGLLLKAGTVVAATLIAVPSSTKNASGERDPEMHQSKKGNQWYFGMKAHIGVDAESGLVHTVRSTAGHVNDLVEGNSLLHGEETGAFGGAGYQGVDKRPDAKLDVTWHVAIRPGRCKALDLSSPLAALIYKSQQILAGIRARVEHPSRVIKRQFGFTKVRYRVLKKNAAQVQTLFALSNLWMTRRKLMAGRV